MVMSGTTYKVYLRVSNYVSLMMALSLQLLLQSLTFKNLYIPICSMSCEEENCFHISHNGNYLYDDIDLLRPSDAYVCV